MKTTFVKNYIDEILVGENSPKDYELLKKWGYDDDSGEVSLTMMFGDGIAYDTSMNGVVMHYPTLYDVSQSEEMQSQIRLHCGERCDDHIEQWDVALTFGRIGRYKYVLNYDEWVEHGENHLKPIFALYRNNTSCDLGHSLDSFEDEYYEVCDKGLVACDDFDDGEYLIDGLTDEQIEELQAEYGILWTENLGDHQYNENGRLERVKDNQKVYVVEDCWFDNNDNYLDCHTEVYADEEKAKARVNALSKAYASRNNLDTFQSLSGAFGYVFYYLNDDKRKVKYTEKEVE